jgi:hypothetical protein
VLNVNGEHVSRDWPLTNLLFVKRGSINEVGRRFKSFKTNDLELVDLTGGSWNHIAVLLRRIDVTCLAFFGPVITGEWR